MKEYWQRAPPASPSAAARRPPPTTRLPAARAVVPMSLAAALMVSAAWRQAREFAVAAVHSARTARPWDTKVLCRVPDARPQRPTALRLAVSGGRRGRGRAVRATEQDVGRAARGE